MEAGAASEIVALSKRGGISLAPEQRLLTPFQRMVVVLETKRQNEEMQEQMDDQQLNSARQPRGGSMSGDTVTYVNESA